MTDLEQRLSKLQKQFHGLRIIGGEGVIVHGSPTKGYAVEVKASPADSSGAGGGGPGPTSTGACCIGGVCHILTAADCATMGGTYQGDGVACVDVTCGVCPELTLVCDQVCSSLTKCGYQRTQDGDPVTHYYLRADLSWSEDFTCPGACGVDDDGHTVIDISQSYVWNATDPTACTVTCTGTSHFESCCQIDPGDCTLDESICDFCAPTDAPTSNCNICQFDPCATYPFPSEPYPAGYTCTTSSSLTSTSDTLTLTSGMVPVGTSTYTFSDEYTTADLITNVYAALPTYDGVFDDACSASLEQASDESSYSICRFKYKWTFAAAATANCTLTWNEHTAFDDMTTSDNARSTSISIGQTETSVFEALEPAANGTTTITDVVCVCP